jgi:hypothetical protein
MFMPGVDRLAAAVGPLAEVTDGTVFGVVTETLPEPTATEAPVPGTEADTAGSSEGIGSGGIGSSMLPEGTAPLLSSDAVAPAADALRPAADAVTVALLGEEFKRALPSTRA